jgi:hypothetical protein
MSFPTLISSWWEMVVVYPYKDLKFMVEHDIICMAIFLTSPNDWLDDMKVSYMPTEGNYVFTHVQRVTIFHNFCS